MLQMKQGFMVAGIRCVMKCFKESIVIRTLTGVELGAFVCSDIKVVLDRLDHCRMRLEDSNKMMVECTFRTPEARERATPRESPAQRAPRQNVRWDCRALRVILSENRALQTRDLWALVVRELSGDSIEMRNTDEYMAGYKPKDTYIIQEEEDDFMDEED